MAENERAGFPLSDDSKEIGLWLRSLREHAGLSQKRLAISVGVDRRRIIAWEKGDSLPGTRYLLAFFAACGVRLEAAEPPPLTFRRPETQEQLARAIEEMTAQVVVLTEAAARLSDVDPGDEPGRQEEEAAS